MEKRTFIAEQAELIARHWPGRDHVILRLARWALPHPGTLLTMLVLFGAFLFIQNASAGQLSAPNTITSSTTTISYQGRLADSNSNPITTNVAMQFHLYSSNIGGAPLWSETQAAVPVENGLFHVLLGSVNPVQISTLASNSTLWLGITVGADSEMTPREQIASAPYAMMASSVLDGSITNSKIADGAVTANKLAPGVIEIPDGSITTAKLADASVSSRKFSPTQAYYNQVVTAGSTSSSTPGDLNDTIDSIPLTLETDQWVYLFYETTSSATNQVIHYMWLEFDGAIDDSSLIETSSSSNGTMAGVYKRYLSAGAHTIKAKYSVAVAGQTATYWRRRIMALAIGP